MAQPNSLYRKKLVELVRRFALYLRHNEPNAKPFSAIPGPKGLPYIGMLLHFKQGPFFRFPPEEFHLALTSWFKQYGPIMKETTNGATIVHLFRPEYFRVIFQQEGRAPEIAPLLETAQLYRRRQKTSPGVGNINGEKWYQLRKALQDTIMRPYDVREFLPATDQIINEFVSHVDKWLDSNNEIQDFSPYLGRLNLEISIKNLLENRLGALDSANSSSVSLAEQMIAANKAVFEVSTRLRFGLPWFKLWRTPVWNDYAEAEATFFNKCGQPLVDTAVCDLQDLQQRGVLREGQYRYLRHVMGKSDLSYADLSILTISSMADGLNTTVPTLVYVLYCLATHSQTQDLLYQEIKGHELLNQGQPLTSKALGGLPYLKACVKEAMRFFPLGLDITRILPCDVTVDGYFLPAGTRVEMNNFVLLESSEFFPAPKEFRPERWLQSRNQDGIDPFLHLPFSHGPRMCPGRRLVEQEVAVLLIRLLQTYRIQWRGSNMGQTFKMLLFPDSPLFLRFDKRSVLER